MGACDYVIKINANNENELGKRIESAREEMGHEDGTGIYCGNWNAKDRGYRVLRGTFKNYNQACDHILENNNKWNCVDAAKVEEKEGTPAQNARIEKQKEKISEARKKVTDFISDWVLKVRKGKSKTKSCKHCKRRFLVEDIRGIHCSGCKKTFLTESQETRLSKMNEKVKIEEDKLQSMIDKKGGKTKKYWVVGGLCPC